MPFGKLQFLNVFLVIVEKSAVNLATLVKQVVKHYG